ncbi:hypothetical protein PLICRDRAFT_108900 [Plicaturopsis crispa FD-325 SS-3]|nr:hypothetical protein PLICRDRAFT_108900 [Plicaturopsis crispa FD-325 SS-3]
MSASAPSAIAVYCASSLGKEKAYQNAAISVGNALVAAKRPLVYGGGSKGIMGVVSGTVRAYGGKVIGIIPHAMVAAGGEGDKTGADSSSKVAKIVLDDTGRENVETIIVDSMHERKVEMAKRSGGFIGLPGGFGTFEEVLEVSTWTQVGIHNKPVVVLNVLSFWEPLRALIRSGIDAGFIHPRSERIIVFVDGPADHATHENYDWGKAAVEAIDSWVPEDLPTAAYDWSKRVNGGTAGTAVPGS